MYTRSCERCRIEVLEAPLAALQSKLGPLLKPTEQRPQSGLYARFASIAPVSLDTSNAVEGGQTPDVIFASSPRPEKQKSKAPPIARNHILNRPIYRSFRQVESSRLGDHGFRPFYPMEARRWFQTGKTEQKEDLSKQNTAYSNHMLIVALRNKQKHGKSGKMKEDKYDSQNSSFSSNTLGLQRPQGRANPPL